jgi:outer membrane protein assembly factor BamE (lipoprotein component of BamABCDE complex)
MLKTLVIVLALLIAAVNVLAKTERTTRRSAQGKPLALRVGPPTTYLQEGLTREEVVRSLGEPTNVAELGENELLVTRYQFKRGGNRILIAEFVNNVLVSSRTETRDEELAQASR